MIRSEIDKGREGDSNPEDFDRKQASPTESAGRKDREREHSGADISNSGM